MASYKVWTKDVNGTWMKYDGSDKSEFEAVVAKLDKENARRAALPPAPWLKQTQYYTEIIEDEPVAESIIEDEVVESAEEIESEAVTVFYSNSKEVDISESVRATIQAARGPFTQQQIIDALAAANPDDEDCSDERELARQVKAALRMFSNPMSALLPICEAVSDGRYERR